MSSRMLKKSASDHRPCCVTRETGEKRATSEMGETDDRSSFFELRTSDRVFLACLAFPASLARYLPLPAPLRVVHV